MNFTSKEMFEKMLRDEMFYQKKDCFCLGKTMEEAGMIIMKIVNDTEKEKNSYGNRNVGVDNKNA